MVSLVAWSDIEVCVAGPMGIGPDIVRLEGVPWNYADDAQRLCRKTSLIRKGIPTDLAVHGPTPIAIYVRADKSSTSGAYRAYRRIPDGFTSFAANT